MCIIAGNCIPVIATAQSRNGRITGRVVDSLTREPLQGATITAVDDSSGLYIAYALSNKKGAFTLSSLPAGQRLAVLISHMGYRDTSALFTLSGHKPLVNSGDWILAPMAKVLKAITITARRLPFTIRNDTLEFNATAFQSLPNDMVQELLRKLPGVVVDEQGNITVNGKKVDKILVDGREFFGGNLRIATQNLPGSIIDKVQVTNTRDQAQEYSSVIKPLTNNVTLNLTLKKENKNGLFGQVGVAGGTAGRYQANAFINAFQGIKRLSITGSTGNGPSLGGEAGEQDNGLIKNITQAGVNFNNDIGKKAQLSANYTMSDNSRSMETLLERINLLPDSSFLYNSNTHTDDRGSNHVLQADLKVDIDSLQQLQITPTLSFAKSRFLTFSHAQSTTMTGALINSQQNENQHITGPAFDVNNVLNYIRFSKDRKTVFTLNWSFNLSWEQGSQNNQAQNTFTGNGGGRDSTNQYGDLHQNGFGNNVTLNINRSLGNLVLIFNYNFQQNRYRDDKDVYNFNSGSHQYDLLDSVFSNHNLNTASTHVSTIRLGYQGEKFSAELAGAMRLLQQDNRIIWKDSTVRVKQQNFLPILAMAYKPSSTFQLTASYTLLAIAPMREQLNPVPDNTNPLLIKEGNPFLRSAIIHNFNAQGNFFSRDFKWKAGFGTEGSLIAGQVTEDIRYDNLGRQVLTWRNVNGNRNYSINLSTGTGLPLNNWRLSLEVNGKFSHNRSVGYINGKENTSTGLGLDPSFNLQLGYKTVFSLQANGGIDLNRTSYSLADFPAIYYDVKRLQVVTRINPAKRLQISSSLYYIFNSQLPAEFQPSRTFINAGISYNFLKEERLTIGLFINDLLDNNINTIRTITSTSIETVQVNALRRYGVLSISYRISEFQDQ